jgi:hypothetical protein
LLFELLLVLYQHDVAALLVEAGLKSKAALSLSLARDDPQRLHGTATRTRAQHADNGGPRTHSSAHTASPRPASTIVAASKTMRTLIFFCQVDKKRSLIHGVAWEVDLFSFNGSPFED